MNDSVKVSVIIPVYNGGMLLQKCLDDLICQTLEEIEIICVNDGSTDDTPEILEQYAKRDSRILPFHQGNGGAAAARNYGLTKARGRYVLFLDADDFFEPDMLEKTWRRACKLNADIVLFKGDRYRHQAQEFIPMKYALRDEMLPSKEVFHYHDISDYVFNFVVGWAWDKLYRREFIETAGLSFQNLRTSNDLYFTFLSLILADRICVEDSLLIHHRIQINESLSVTRERSWNCFYLAGKKLYDKLQSLGVYPEVELSFVNWMLHFSFWNLETIEGPCREKVYNLIRSEVLPLVQFSRFHREDIRQPGLYKKIKDMQSMDFLEYTKKNHGYRIKKILKRILQKTKGFKIKSFQ